jgi:long-chain-fatty-acid--[acyl-carrier-protein] ligase
MGAYLGENYGIKGLTTEDLSTVSQIIAMAAKGEHKTNESASVEVKTPKEWLGDNRTGEVSVAPGETLIEAFLQQASQTPKALAIGSDQSGVLNYKRAKIAVLLLAARFAELPGKYVGLMLPATAAANLSVLALMLAGKVPVMINWTQGPRHLESVVRSSGIEVCLTSWVFIEKLEGVEFGPLDDITLMLEDMRQKFSFSDKLRAAMRSMRSVKSILKSYGATKLSSDDHAVVLFTSGTEAEPKGVPLTHGNILSNLRSSIQTLRPVYSDCIMSILPPFHSFGFTITGMLPLVTGMSVATYPDPTDGLGVARSIQRWKATLIAGAPSFLNGVLQAATPEMLESLRVIVTGAERAPKSLLEHAERLAPHVQLVEGYGITECSPVLSVNLDARNPVGVGKAVEGVEFLIVRTETHEPVEKGERGLLLCRGPNVFHGYLQGTERDPFITVEGKKWYNTGDLGYLDDEDNLILAGRLKRFAKIGGEMVSLGAVEEAVLAAAPEWEWPLQLEGPSVAVLAEETTRKTLLTLACTFEASTRQINKVLNTAGFSNLVRVSKVKQVDHIPLMGTGKVNYRELTKMAAK